MHFDNYDIFYYNIKNTALLFVGYLYIKEN